MNGSAEKAGGRREFALASCALAVPGEDEGACPQERFGTLG